MDFIISLLLSINETIGKPIDIILVITYRFIKYTLYISYIKYLISNGLIKILNHYIVIIYNILKKIIIDWRFGFIDDF